jgi:hypothetical protein
VIGLSNQATNIGLGLTQKGKQIINNAPTNDTITAFANGEFQILSSSFFICSSPLFAYKGSF